MLDQQQFSDLRDQVRHACRDMSAAGLDEQRGLVAARIGALSSYANRSQPQEAELDEKQAEVVFLDEMAGEKRTAERSEKVEKVRRAALDPANREGPNDGAGAVHSAARAAPAYVKGKLGTRLESAGETVQRMGNPWRDQGGPLDRETGAGYVSRANTALEGMSERLTHDGAELLSSLLSERRETRGVSVRRSADEVREAAEMILALSSPHYESAMRSVFRNPDLFRTGLGNMVWSDDERTAMHDVMNNYACRAAFAETSGAVGAYALPLQLDPTILFTNAGIASAHRQLARHELGTSNTWNGITSAGSTSNFVTEGTAVTDTTPSIGALVITPGKIMTWIYGSFEAMSDTELSGQVPALFDEARGRLEGAAFATGSGTFPAPWGAVTRAAVDATAGNPTAALIYAMDQNLPPRFRNGGRVAWMANETVRNICRQIPSFTGSVTSIVNDNTPDGIPEMLGYDFYESSAMAGGTTGNRELLLGDFSAYLIVDRLPNTVLAEPLVVSSATALPTGQRGWLAWSRVGADTVTQGAALGSNAFTVHVH